MAKKNPDNEAMDALQEIKQAEERAREIIQEAQEKTSSRIVQDAYDEAEKIKENFLKEAKEEAEKRKKEIIDEAKEERNRIEQETDKEVLTLRQKTKARMPEAVPLQRQTAFPR